MLNCQTLLTEVNFDFRNAKVIKQLQHRVRWVKCVYHLLTEKKFDNNVPE